MSAVLKQPTISLKALIKQSRGWGRPTLATFLQNAPRSAFGYHTDTGTRQEGKESKFLKNTNKEPNMIAKNRKCSRNFGFEVNLVRARRRWAAVSVPQGGPS